MEGLINRWARQQSLSVMFCAVGFPGASVADPSVLACNCFHSSWEPKGADFRTCVVSSERANHLLTFSTLPFVLMSERRWGEYTNAREENARFSSLGRQNKTYEQPGDACTHAVCARVFSELCLITHRHWIYIFIPLELQWGMQEAQRDRVGSPPASNPTGKPLGFHLGQTKYSNITLKLSAYSGPLETLVIRSYQCQAPLSQRLNVNRFQDSSKRKPSTGSNRIIRANYWTGDSVAQWPSLAFLLLSEILINRKVKKKKKQVAKGRLTCPRAWHFYSCYCSSLLISKLWQRQERQRGRDTFKVLFWSALLSS